MLKLKLATDPRWVNIAEKNIEEILIDHAFCEQKAASTAISFIVTYPEYSDLVADMTDLAREEMQHFKLVHNKLLERGLKLGFDRKDPYVADIRKFFNKTKDRKLNLVNRLLLAAMIEARSCERFRLLSENIKDQELSKFYYDLMKSEATHYTMFLQYARKFGEGRMKVDEVWEQFLEFEADVMKNYSNKELIHG
mgnify:CR=1 FL=1|jgi:tRNA 2-(methylsulfanyl)-N6-isopentenyladenosine37 hydroxylase|tara:strand:- start:80 stop:664 length:585 start_codon:yes stop_codon:yes gene_type:complete